MKQCMSMPGPLGDILLRAEDDALTGVYFVGQKYFPAADGALAALFALQFQPSRRSR